jgi:hypothetical protein
MVDQAHGWLRRLIAFRWAPERLGEPLHVATVDAGDVRMKVRDVHRRARQPLRQLVLLRLQLAQPHHQRTAVAAGLYDGDDLLEPLFDIGERLPVRLAAGAALALRRLVSSA